MSKTHYSLNPCPLNKSVGSIVDNPASVTCVRCIANNPDNIGDFLPFRKNPTVRGINELSVKIYGFDQTYNNLGDLLKFVENDLSAFEERDLTVFSLIMRDYNTENKKLFLESVKLGVESVWFLLDQLDTEIESPKIKLNELDNSIEIRFKSGSLWETTVLVHFVRQVVEKMINGKVPFNPNNWVLSGGKFDPIGLRYLFNFAVKDAWNQLRQVNPGRLHRNALRYLFRWNRELILSPSEKMARFGDTTKNGYYVRLNADNINLLGEQVIGSNMSYPSVKMGRYDIEIESSHK